MIKVHKPEHDLINILLEVQIVVFKEISVKNWFIEVPCQKRKVAFWAARTLHSRGIILQDGFSNINAEM